MCVQVQKWRCRYPQLCPCIPKPSGSPRNTRSFNAISPEKTASECGVRENPIHPLLLSSARNVDRYRKSHEILCPPASIRPWHASSPIRFSPISKKNGLAPRLLNPEPFELALLKPSSPTPAFLEAVSLGRRLSTGNP